MLQNKSSLSYQTNFKSLHTDTKAADKSLTVGRLYHHLAVLARPNASQPFRCSASTTFIALGADELHRVMSK
jgi:hypothetical protein